MRIRIRDPKSFWPWITDRNFSIPDPGSRVKKITDPGSGSASKNLSILNLKTVSKLSEKLSGMFIPDLELNFFVSRIPHPDPQKLVFSTTFGPHCHYMRFNTDIWSTYWMGSYQHTVRSSIVIPGPNGNALIWPYLIRIQQSAENKIYKLTLHTTRHQFWFPSFSNHQPGSFSSFQHTIA